MRGKGSDGGAGDSISLADYRLARGDGMIHSEIRALYGYWERLRGNRPCPDRAEVDPRDIATDARHLFLLEDLGQGNLRFRLAGSALLDAFGFDLRGMSVRAIMAGQARESLLALIAETLAEPGVGYARLLAPDGVTVWEIVLLPLRSSLGEVDRLIGCLHPVSGRVPEAGPVPLRFTIESMTIQPIAGPAREGTQGGTQGGAQGGAPDRPPAAPGFAEEAMPFAPAPRKARLTAIEGGRPAGERASGGKPTLKVVKGEE